MLYKFVSGILGGLGSIVAKLISVIKSVLGITGKVLTAPGKVISKGLGSGKLGAGAKAGFETTAIVGGLGTYGKVNSGGLNDVQLKNMETFSKISKRYGDKDPFD